MSKLLFSKDGIDVTQFCMGGGVIGFQVTWGWRKDENIQVTDRKQAFILANFLRGNS